MLSAKALGNDYFCFFEKKADVMGDFYPEEQTIDSQHSDKQLIQIIGSPVAVEIRKSELIYKLKVYEKEKIMKFEITESDKQKIIAWDYRQKLSTFFSFNELKMVFTELLSGDHIVAYFYNCKRGKK